MVNAAQKGRVEWLESLLEQFIARTDRSLDRMEKGLKQLHEEMQEFKDEMKDFKGETGGLKDGVKGLKNKTGGFEERMEKEAKRMNKQWGELANKMGTIVEDLVVPSIPRIASELFDCEYIEDLITWRYKTKPSDSSRRREFDAIAICPGKVIFNETKSNPRPEYISDFISFIESGEFFEYFPEYREKTMIPIFSSLHLPENAVRQLTSHGIYAMGMSESTMELLNYESLRAG